MAIVHRLRLPSLIRLTTRAMSSQTQTAVISDHDHGVTPISSAPEAPASPVSANPSSTDTNVASNNYKEPPAQTQPQTPPSFDWESICGKTPMSQIATDIERLKKGFRTGKTLDLDWRLDQLRNLCYTLRDNEQKIQDAIKADLKRPDFETMAAEFAFQWGEFNHVIKMLPKWVKDEKIKGVSMTYMTSSPKIRKRPLGTVLVISPWNYPFMLAVSPVVGAIAAGNAVAIKLSEMSPTASKVIGELMAQALDPEIFQVFYGGVPETTEILKHRFDKIMYTGNGKVGRIIGAAANEFLTPVELELGGKSPVFVTKHCSNIEVAARRIMWGKFLNAGQTCVAPDYVIVAPEVHEKFVKACVKIQAQFYPKGDHDLAHIATPLHFQRLTSLIAETQGTVVCGGTGDAATRYIAPTVVDNVTGDDALMQGELFGPILPILAPMTTEQGIDFVLKNHPTPLAMYIFSDNSSEVDHIQNNVTSGGMIINDTLLHVGCAQAPFGGVGQSGNGAYHGVHSFNTFSHSQTYLKQPMWVEFLQKRRYPPYTKTNQSLVKNMTISSPSFPRHGDVRGFWSRLFN